MLKFLNLSVIFIVATIAHWMGIEVFSRFDINIGVMLAFAIIVAVVMPRQYAYLYGFVSGLFLDFFGNTMFGGYALAFTVLLYIFYTVSDKIDFNDIGPQLAIPFGLNIGLVLLYGLLSSLFAGEFIWQGIYSLILGSAITALLLPIFYQFTIRVLIFDAFINKDDKPRPGLL